MFHWESILERCKQNDPLAQAELYKKLAGLLFGVCLRYLKSKETAEDCLQESFIKIFTNINSYKGDGPFEAWCRRITVNEILNDYRKKNVLKNSLELETAENAPDLDIDLSRKFSHEELLMFINQLPDGKKIVFNLYVIEGYTHKEIAQMLSISEGTSKSQLHKAKELLMEIHKKNELTYAAK